MCSDNRRESPLVGRRESVRGEGSPAGARVLLHESQFRGHLNLRGNPNDPEFLRLSAQILGGDLPLMPNTVAAYPECRACWLGPEEWLVITAPSAQLRLKAAMDTALAELHFSVTDVSGGQTIIRVQGQHAVDTLAKGCTLDLHPRVFGEGQCAQTLLAKSAALIIANCAGVDFEVVVRRSFADYLWLWLNDAASEYGLAVLAQELPSEGEVDEVAAAAGTTAAAR